MKKTNLLLIAIICLTMGLSACAMFQPQQTAQNQAQESVGRYYDFDDVQVPTVLKLDKDKSIIFRAGSLKAGVLVLKDNVETESLINFFLDSMGRDNWVLKSSYKYPKTVLFFAKPGKTCIIQITENAFETNVEIWVAPAA